ncbi:hypothetical protein ABZ721_33155 [Streptomyces sp. NPDC006733]|uniref:hypothetical protein n=1 Tax=Streptomyces sp. NPDC006733 TaxID=3155460 RepID=UPI0033D813D8
MVAPTTAAVPALAGRMLAGHGRVTVARHGGGAGPDWGAYVLMVTIRRLNAQHTEAVIAATAPEDVDPAWGLHRPLSHGPTGSSRRPLLEYAAASLPPTPRGRTHHAGAHQQRLQFLLRAGLALRLSAASQPGTIDLPWALWEIRVEHTGPLLTLTGSTVGYGGHSTITIGRLITLTPKET